MEKIKIKKDPFLDVKPGPEVRKFKGAPEQLQKALREKSHTIRESYEDWKKKMLAYEDSQKNKHYQAADEFKNQAWHLKRNIWGLFQEINALSKELGQPEVTLEDLEITFEVPKPPVSEL